MSYEHDGKGAVEGTVGGNENGWACLGGNGIAKGIAVDECRIHPGIGNGMNVTIHPGR